MNECQLGIKYRNIEIQSSQNMTFAFVSIKFVSKHIFFFMIKLFPNWSILMLRNFTPGKFISILLHTKIIKVHKLYYNKR